MALIKSFVDSSKYDVKCPYSMTPIGVCIHNTANDATAKNEIAYMKSNNNEVSFHIAVDDNEAIQGIPFDRNAWAAGDGGKGEGNRKYIHVEICYSKSGGTRFINAEKRAAKEIAAILKSYGWGVDRVKKHQDFSGKYCPHRTLDMGYQRIIDMIKAELGSANPSNPIQSTPSSNVTGDIYRVVAGSYSARENADNMVKKLKAEGIESFILPVVANDGKTYLRVIAGSYGVKANADKIMKDLIGKGFPAFIAIYDNNDNRVPSNPVNTSNVDKEVKRYSENGTCTITTSSGIKFRDKPCTTTGNVEGAYSYKESVHYDLVVITEKYTWISWIGASSGKRRYMPIVDRLKNERWGTCV